MSQQGLHANFKLSKSGESLIFAGSENNIIDSVSFTEQVTDISTGRYPNGTGSFIAMTPSFSDTNNITSVNEYYLDTGFSIYPNPAKYVLYVEFFSSNKSTFEFYNIMLQKIDEFSVSKASNRLSVSLERYSDGIYFIKAGNIVTKLIIVR
ncbi:MAG: T9SS type A sorting domain-containing protein [Bacteroidia bacterium]|nr:T9SS type A sorting domain-containing protein [Bacteroidia bacterium]